MLLPPLLRRAMSLTDIESGTTRAVARCVASKGLRICEGILLVVIVACICMVVTTPSVPAASASSRASDVAEKPFPGPSARLPRDVASEPMRLAECPALKPEVNGSVLLRQFMYYGHNIYSAYSHALRSLGLRDTKFIRQPLRQADATGRWPLFVFTRQQVANESPILSRLISKIDGGDETVPHLNFVQGVFNSIAGSKAMQVVSKRQLAFRHNCSFDTIGLQPQTYVTFDAGECAMLQRGMVENKLFIIKPRNGGKGQGIKVLRGSSDVMQALYQLSCVKKERPSYIVQDYLVNPLLIEGSKFDMRAYMLIGSTEPFTVFFRHGYVRRSLTKYDATASDVKAHLTNTHVQQNIRGYSGNDHVWSMERLAQYVERPEVGAEPGWVRGVLLPHMARTARMLFESSRHRLKRRRGSFHLIGLDFMIDADLRIHFIEANSAPGMGYQSNWKSQLSRRISRDAFALVHTIQSRPSIVANKTNGDMLNGFQLVYNERKELCDAIAELGPAATPEAVEEYLSQSYNLCAAFDAPMGIPANAPGVKFSSGEDAEQVASEEGDEGEEEDTDEGDTGVGTDSAESDSDASSTEPQSPDEQSPDDQITLFR